MSSQPPPGYQPPPGFPAPPQAPPAGPRRPPATILAVLLIVGGLVAGGLAGGVVGAVAGYALAEADGPEAPPPPPDEFPNGDQRFLAGVTVDLIAERWLKKNNKYTCAEQDAKSTASGAKHKMRCEAPGDLNYEVDVLIEYDDDTHVRYVVANCRFKPGANACKTLFENLAYGLLYNDEELREQAQDWAGKNADTDNSTTIGGVSLQVSLEPHRIVGLPAS